MEQKIRNITYTILNLSQIIVLLFALMIYTSFNKNLPWYESCGTQFLVIPIVCIPLLLMIGVGLKFLSKKYNMSSLNIKLPFYSAAAIFLPIILDLGMLSRVLVAIGALVCIALIIMTIYVITIHFKNFIINKHETV
ncbi:hypothetical protein [Clostridium ganghwense]|uniref:Uncharacterized protein n=1 Tax=Clostridium ganghwense TaxID=312089 RepID=A0ABT4CK94_9CLOT|nr:hypothetical protein [Clostridium ganghwense]MCY6369473.1 hypothetical protein [Clostridium ganghwense]